MTSQTAQILFSDDQIKQLRQVIREEVETESKDIKHIVRTDELGIKVKLSDLNNKLKDLGIENSRDHKKLETMIEQNKKDIIKNSR